MPRTPSADCELCGAEGIKRRLCCMCRLRICKSCWTYRPCAKFGKGGHRERESMTGARVKKKIRRMG